MTHKYSGVYSDWLVLYPEYLMPSKVSFVIGLVSMSAVTGRLWDTQQGSFGISLDY